MILIDIYLMVQMLVPPALSYDWLIEYVKSAAYPVKQLTEEFYLYFDDKKYELTFDGRVIALEHILNDTFDPIARSIYIDDANLISSNYIFLDIENNEPFYLRMNSESATPVYLFTNQEYIDDLDFIVFIPSAVSFDLTLLTKIVNIYKLAPMRWEHQII